MKGPDTTELEAPRLLPREEHTAHARGGSFTEHDTGSEEEEEEEVVEVESEEKEEEVEAEEAEEEVEEEEEEEEEVEEVFQIEEHRDSVRTCRELAC